MKNIFVSSLLGFFYFGTVLGVDIALNAKEQIGSSVWAYGNKYVADTFTAEAGTYKSHLFVYDVLKPLISNPPMMYSMHGCGGSGMHHMMMGCSMPIRPSDWANTGCSYMNSCWELCDYDSQIDGIISNGTHVAIVTGDQLTTSVNMHEVEESDWGFRSGGYGSVETIKACWQYVC